MGNSSATTTNLQSPNASVSADASCHADRTLLARLHYTRVQRGAGQASVWRGAGQVVSWFPYQICGVRTGLHEGVVLGSTVEAAPEWLQALGDDTGARLFKLTRPVPAPLPPCALPTERLPHWTVSRRATRAREVLPLAASFEAALASMGRHTRRNIRAALKLAAAERLAFEPSTTGALLSDQARAELARQNQPHRPRASLIARLEAYADGTLRPFRSVVRGADGRVVSYACGYFGDAASAYLLYQLNDQALNAIGPSLLHRAFLIRWLIEQGCREFVFVHGCSGVLHHSCVRQPLEEIWLMRRSAPALLTAGVIGLCKPNASIGRLARLSLVGQFSDGPARP